MNTDTRYAPGDTVRLDDGHNWTVRATSANFTALTRPVSQRDRDEQAAEYDHPDDECGFVTYATAESGVDYCDHVSHYSDPPNLDHEGPFYTVIDWRNRVRGPVQPDRAGLGRRHLHAGAVRCHAGRVRGRRTGSVAPQPGSAVAPGRIAAGHALPGLGQPDGVIGCRTTLRDAQRMKTG